MKQYSTLFHSVLLLLLTISLPNLVFSQNTNLKTNDLAVIKQLLIDEYDYSKNDLKELSILQSLLSSNHKAKYLYIQQYFQEVPIFNAISVATIGDKVRLSKPKFVKDINTLYRTEKENSFQSALETVLKSENISKHIISNSLSTQKDGYLLIPQEESPNFPFRIRKEWLVQSNMLHKCWSIEAYFKSKNSYKKYLVSMQSNEILHDVSYQKTCSFSANHKHDCSESHFEKPIINSAENFLNNIEGQYLVFAKQTESGVVPLESPLVDNQNLIINPADMTASPMGWHSDGTSTFTDTRGNNANVLSSTFDFDDGMPIRPNGGENLIFDEATVDSLNPSSNINQSITNNFFMTNYIHDLLFHYGFDEASGNFQKVNFTNNGNENDEVIVVSNRSGVDSETFNNATFSSPPDGLNGIMNTAFWGGLNLTATFSSASNTQLDESTDVGFATFEEPPYTTDWEDWVDLKLVPVEDDGTESGQACGEITNATEVDGNIALIDRGECFFVDKVIKAQEIGAIGVVICNNVDGQTVGMSGNSNVPINIHSIMLRKQVCDSIKVALQQDSVLITLSEDGSSFYSVDFDNGVIAHEYGHGLSIRLTGGAGTSSCLDNSEQMGEGISDFLTLTTTVTNNNTPQSRSIGAYVSGQEINGQGIRLAPYTNDLEENGLTYNAIRGSMSEHFIGTVWASALWDIYLGLVDRYGFDENLKTGSGGNNIALQLMVEGLKIQPCEPGFQDARDAILMADTILYDAANACLLWEAFARRGMGTEMDQGFTTSVDDGVESFKRPQSCETTNNSEYDLSNNIQVIPNPTESTFTLSIDNYEYPENIKIYSINGALIRQIDINKANQEININNLSAGIYFINLTINNQSVTKKIVKH